MQKAAKIKLDRKAGPIVFLGSMNAMPMMYALELKKDGFEVLYFVDAPITDALSRPENHFPGIEYPYPSWIVEIKLKTQMLLPYFQIGFSRYIESKILGVSALKPQAFILNGFFISLATHLRFECPKVALSHGSDLDSWADLDGENALAASFSQFSFYKYFPLFLAKFLIKIAVSRQNSGLMVSDKVVYFPRGFNANGDRVIARLESHGVNCLERYDISFEPLKEQSRAFKRRRGKLVIFSGVRFTYETFSEGNAGYSKGSDIMIRGLAKYYSLNKDIVIHFVEKGPDVGRAKALCTSLGVDSAVIWHKEMKFHELLSLYSQSDICFDQVGKHWIGAIGGYALWLGKPLIANDKLPIDIGLWPKDNPVCSAQTAEEVCAWVQRLGSDDLRESISYRSKCFVEKYMSPTALLNRLFQYDNS